MIKKDQKTKLYQEKLESLEARLRQLRLDLVKNTQLLKRGQEKNTKAARIIRYQIALINTIIAQKRFTSEKTEK